MLRLVSIALISLSVLAGAHPHVEAPVEESKAERDALLTSKTLTLSEGLPNPAKEHAAFATEQKRRDKRVLVDFHFYTPELKPDAARIERLRKLLADPSHIAQWSHRRRGGFIPDWSVNWRAGRQDLHAFISFSCQEVIFISPDQQLRYDLTAAAFKMLHAELAPLRTKRPAP